MQADDLGGFTCCVYQGHYGHLMQKATWLYAYGVDLPDLVWGPSQGHRADAGYHTHEERQAAKMAGSVKVADRVPAEMLKRTPPRFRDLLIETARTSSLRPSMTSQVALL